MFLGLTGFTAINGSKVSSSVQFPGGAGKPVSQLPTALGRESSISGPSVEAVTPFGSASTPASAKPARPAPNFFSAEGRVTDWARLLVSSSNLLFILPFRFVVWFWFVVVVLCALPSNGQPARNPLASPTFQAQTKRNPPLS